MCFRFLEHVAVVRPMSMSAVVDAVQLAVCSAEPARLRALQPITHRSYSDICPKYCDSLPSSSLSLPFLIPSLPSFPSPIHRHRHHRRVAGEGRRVVVPFR